MRYRKRAMIVAAQPEATEAGAEILKAGGNAVDAAMACAFVQGVVDPLMCGIAGFGSCGIAMPATGFHGYIDFHAPAPLATRPDMWADRIESEARDGYGFILRGRVNDIGYQAICAPASLRAYRDAHREHGRLPWEQILEPAIAWAEGGWTVRPHVGSWWAEDGADGPRREPRAPGVHAGLARALLPARRHAQAGGRPRGEPRPRPDAAAHRQARRRGILRRRDRPRHRGGHAQARRPDRGRGSARLAHHAQRAALGDLSALPCLEQPAAGRRRDAARDAEHPRALPARLARAQLGRVRAVCRRGHEARHDRQGPPRGRSALRGRAGGPARGQGLRGGDGRADPCGQEGRRAALQPGRSGQGHHPRLRRGRRAATA